jgi:hypothetical protein
VRPLRYPGRWADQRHLIDEAVRDGGSRGGLPAGEIVLLDPAGRVAEAVAAGEVVIEVPALRAHPADVEREPGLDGVAGAPHVVVDDDRGGRREVEAVEGAPGAIGPRPQFAPGRGREVVG